MPDVELLKYSSREGASNLQGQEMQFKFHGLYTSGHQKF